LRREVLCLRRRGFPFNEKKRGKLKSWDGKRKKEEKEKLIG